TLSPCPCCRSRKSGNPVNAGRSDVLEHHINRPGVLGPRLRGDDRRRGGGRQKERLARGGQKQRRHEAVAGALRTDGRSTTTVSNSLCSLPLMAGWSGIFSDGSY